MSEYQHYEFRAIDRPLKSREMASLRNLSTRAEITPTSFVNEYQYGDFKGDPAILMDRYFDAFVYVANWGTHRLMFRIPGVSSTSPRSSNTAMASSSRSRPGKSTSCSTSDRKTRTRMNGSRGRD